MKNDTYFDGLNSKLLNAIPFGRHRILELGCANGQLGSAYKRANPSSHWTGVDINIQALNNAKMKLDLVLNIDLNKNSLCDYFKKNEFDTVIIGDLLEHLVDPEGLINQIHQISTDNSKIIMCIPNMCSLQVVEKIISGDMTYDEVGLMDKTHLRFFSLPSIFKIILDGGYLPNLTDQYNIELKESPFLHGITQAAKSIGMSQKTLYKNLERYQMIIVAIKNCESGHDFNTKVGLSVIVPVTSELQFNENVLKSPGLQEINAQIIKIQNASSAAEAFNKGKEIAKNDWLLFMHQDVYIPKGEGFKIIDSIKKINTNGPIGFAGLEIDGDNIVKEAGTVIDRTSLFMHKSACGDVISIDEFAVILNKNSSIAIDQSLGWHTWGTDLCLQAYLRDDVQNAKIINATLFHNSWNDYSISESYRISSIALKLKYPQLNKIETLCGTII